MKEFSPLKLSIFTVQKWRPSARNAVPNTLEWTILDCFTVRFPLMRSRDSCRFSLSSLNITPKRAKQISSISCLLTVIISLEKRLNRGRISSVGRALDCRAGGRGFDSLGRTISEGLNITEKWRYSLCTPTGETFAWLGWPRKMAAPSPLGDVKMVSPISTFVLNTLTPR